MRSVKQGMPSEHGNSNYSKAKDSAKGFRKLTSFFKPKPVPTPAAPVAPSTPHNSATVESAASTTIDSAKTVQFDPELPEPELAEPGFRGLPVELDEADSGALPDISDAPAIFESLLARYFSDNAERAETDDDDSDYPDVLSTSGDSSDDSESWSDLDSDSEAPASAFPEWVRLAKPVPVPHVAGRMRSYAWRRLAKSHLQ